MTTRRAFTTPSGRRLTNDDVNRLADEVAMAEFDADQIRRRAWPAFASRTTLQSTGHLAPARVTLVADTEEVMSRTSVLANAVRVEPTASERDSAAQIALATASAEGESFTLQAPDGSVVPLSAALLGILRASADELAGGHAVTVLPSEVSLSPAEAAELLGLSRPFVVRLLDQGDIPSQRLPRSRHRRVLLTAVLEFQAQRDRRRTGRQRIAALIEDAELPY